MKGSRYSNYTVVELLKDETFLEWQLNPTYALEQFWGKEIEGDKQLAVNVKIAARVLKTAEVNRSVRLSQSDKDEMFRNIRSRASRRVRFVELCRVASVAAVIAVVSLLSFLPSRTASDEVAEAELFGMSNIESVDLGVFDGVSLILNGVDTIALASGDEVDYSQHGSINIKRADKVNSFVNRGVGSEAYNSLIVPIGNRVRVILADGSKVWVGSGSKLCYSPNMQDSERNLYMDGEIYIEVAKDSARPFHVNTPNIGVKVYGTKFGVSSVANGRVAESVVLAEGSVSISLVEDGEVVSGDELFISPDQKYTLSKDRESRVEAVDAEEYLAWHSGSWMLSHSSLGDIVARLRRYYGVDISLQEDLHDLTCSGRLILDDQINGTLDALSAIFSVDYKISAGESNHNNVFIEITR